MSDPSNQIELALSKVSATLLLTRSGYQLRDWSLCGDITPPDITQLLIESPVEKYWITAYRRR